MIAMIFTAFNAMGWVGRIAAIVGPLLVLGTLYGVWHHKVYTKGYDAALAAVARADARAVGKATEYRNAFKDCRARNMAWDQTTGKCS